MMDCTGTRKKLFWSPSRPTSNDRLPYSELNMALKPKCSRRIPSFPAVAIQKTVLYLEMSEWVWHSFCPVGLR